VREAGWRWHTSRTGGWLQRFETVAIHNDALAKLRPARSGPGQIIVVVDPHDSAEIAQDLGRACRRMGRFVVHTSPGQHRVRRLQVEVLRALGKHWDRAAQGGTARIDQQVRSWLLAEQARELIVLRAHQISVPGLEWLVELAACEVERVWLLSPRGLPALSGDAAGVTVTSVRPAQAVADLAAAHDGVGCGCEDLNRYAPVHGTGVSVAGGLTVATAGHLRCLYDVEAAGLATAAVLLGCPDPDLLVLQHQIF
jgi:hypothetical protein